MSALCIILYVFQFIILLTISGVLLAVLTTSQLVQMAIALIHPATVFVLRQSTALVLLEVVLADLTRKVPCLQEILRPEYTPYLNTACTVLLGWLIVCWLSHTIWTLLAPLTVSAVAIVLICPTTVKWCIKQFLPNLENALNDTITKFHVSMSDKG